MSHNLALYLDDIFTSIGKIERYTAGLHHDYENQPLSLFGKQNLCQSVKPINEP